MEQSGGRSRVLCWELVGLVCFAGWDTSKQGKIKRGQEETRENQEETRKIKRSQGDQCEPRENEMK